MTTRKHSACIQMLKKISTKRTDKSPTTLLRIHVSGRSHWQEDLKKLQCCRHLLGDTCRNSKRNGATQSSYISQWYEYTVRRGFYQSSLSVYEQFYTKLHTQSFNLP